MYCVICKFSMFAFLFFLQRERKGVVVIFFFFLGVNVVGEYEREHFYNVNTSKGDLGQMD